MSPIDDELRAALHRRAVDVPASPDPLAGIERRAQRIHRNRVATAVAGSALAVVAVAMAVPAVQNATSGPTPPSTVASAAPTAVRPASPYALDPDRPWPYRGTPLDQLGTGTLETITREYAVLRGVALSAVTLDPLWGQVDEPSQTVELAFVATVDGQHRWGMARGGEAGPEFPVDEALPTPALALPLALPGDEVARLVVVASPDVGELQYGPDGASEFTAMTSLADGVGIVPLEGDPSSAVYRVLDPAGEEVVRAPVPDVTTPPTTDSPPEQAQPAPTNVVDWPVRGGVRDVVLEQALQGYAEAAGVARERVGHRLLFAGERDGRPYVLLQAWTDGDAQGFAWTANPDGSSSSVLMTPTAPGPALFAAVLDGVLVVVPEPTAGQVLYAPDGDSALEPVPDQGTEVAVLVDRPDGVSGDRLLVLDGDGDPDRPIYRGTVDEALAASS